MFEPSCFDLTAYLERIGVSGALAPDLARLRAIALHHPLAIPFENLDPLLGRPVSLDIEALQRKMVQGGRGGYCYEHNLLLGAALRAIGFEVEGLAARVMWNHPPGASTPRSHMLLLVRVDDEPYVVDGGFGGLTLTAPVRLDPGLEQPTPHEPCRLVRAADDYVMQARVRGEWKAMYRFDLQRQAIIDYEVTSWYLSNNPRSPFVTTLMAARVEPARRYTLRNGELAVHQMHGTSERRVLATATAIRDTLARVFRIQLPDAPELDAALARIAATSAPEERGGDGARREVGRSDAEHAEA